MSVRRTGRLLLILIPLVVFCLPAAAEALSDDIIVRVIRLQVADAGEAAEKIKGLGSEAGTITAYKATNSIIVHDTEAAVARIEAALKDLDRTPARFRFEVVRLTDRELGAISPEIDWKPAGGGWGIGRFRKGEELSTRLALAETVRKVRERQLGYWSGLGTEKDPLEIWVGEVDRSDIAIMDHLDPSARERWPESPLDIRVGFKAVGSVSAGEWDLRLTPRVRARAGEEDNVAGDLPDFEARVRIPENTWMVLSTGGSDSALLERLYMKGAPGSAGGGGNLLVRLVSAQE